MPLPGKDDPKWIVDYMDGRRDKGVVFRDGAKERLFAVRKAALDAGLNLNEMLNLFENAAHEEEQPR
jgi:hypothetical protein